MQRSLQVAMAVAVLGSLILVVGYRTWRDPERRFQAGLAALDADDLAGVEKEIALLEDQRAYSAHRSFLQGTLYLRQGQLQPALNELGKCVEHPDLERDALVLSGEALYKLGMTGNAKLLWERALTLDPDTVNAHRWLGVMYYDLGAMDQALIHLSRVSELDSIDPRPDRLMGLINNDYERPHLAIEHYREALGRMSPSAAEVEQIRLELAECEIKQKEFSTALETASKCSPSPRQWVIQAECHLNLGDHPAARRLVDQALQETPDDLDALLLKGRILLADGHWEAAEKLFARSVETHPSDYQARFQFAQALRRAGEDERATEQEQRASELRDTWSKFSDLHVDAINQPTNAELRYELGTLARKLGRFELARTWFQAALAIDPNHVLSAQDLISVDQEIAGREP